MLANNTGYQLWPLSTGSSDNPSLSQGSPTTFNLDSLPIFQDQLAYYLIGLLVTITGTYTQAGGTGVATPWDVLFRLLVDSLEVRNAWHGTPVSVNFVKGSFFRVVEYVGCGYRRPVRDRGIIPAANGAYIFGYTFLVPLCAGVSEKPHHTALLNLFYKKAQLQINMAAAAVGTTFSPGSSLTLLAARCSAVMLPDSELRLGPAVEWVDYQNAASSGQTQIQLMSFGNNTALTGTERGAGVLFMGALTSVNGQPGSFAAETVTKFSFPWRGQVELQQTIGFYGQLLMCMGPQRAIGDASNQAVANALADTSGFPYAIGKDFSNTLDETAGSLFFPIAAPALDLQLSKVQVADGDQSYFMTATFTGTHHNLVQHVRSWESSKIEDAMRQMVDNGLAKRVLGSNNIKPTIKMMGKQALVNPRKARFFPLKMVAA